MERGGGDDPAGTNGGRGRTGDCPGGSAKSKLTADKAWAALGGSLTRRQRRGRRGGCGGPYEVGGAWGRGLGGGGGGGGGGGPGLNNAHSIVATNEDWRSAVNDMVWEPPPDTGEHQPGAFEEQVGP